MAEDSMALMELVEKYADGDMFGELGQYVLQRLMEIEAEQQIGAGKHERSDERNTHRNGDRDRRLETRMGTMSFKVPKLRSGTYFPSFLEPRKMSEQALVAVVQEAVREGDQHAHGRRSGAGNGDDGDLEEPGLETLQGSR